MGCLLFWGTSFRDCGHCVMKFEKMFGQNLMMDLKIALQSHNHFLDLLSLQDLFQSKKSTCKHVQDQNYDHCPLFLVLNSAVMGNLGQYGMQEVFSLHQFEYFDITSV